MNDHELLIMFIYVIVILYMKRVFAKMTKFNIPAWVFQARCHRNSHEDQNFLGYHGTTPRVKLKHLRAQTPIFNCVVSMYHKTVFSHTFRRAP